MKFRPVLVILPLVAGLFAMGIGVAPRYIEELAVGGGYGNSGAWIEADGDILTNGDLTVDGQIKAGGGYGSTGVTISTTGNVSANGALAVDGAATFGTFSTGHTINRASTKSYQGPRINIGASTAPVKLFSVATSGAAYEAVTIRGRVFTNYFSVPQEAARESIEFMVSIGQQSTADNIVWGQTKLGGGTASGITVVKTGPAAWTIHYKPSVTYVHANASLDYYVVGGGVVVDVSGWGGAADSGTDVPATEGLSVSADVVAMGGLTARGGQIHAGVNGGVRGVVGAWHGSGGAAPGAIKLHSPAGTARYLFVDDSGRLRIHTGLPAFQYRRNGGWSAILDCVPGQVLCRGLTGTVRDQSDSSPACGSPGPLFTPGTSLPSTRIPSSRCDPSPRTLKVTTSSPAS